MKDGHHIEIGITSALAASVLLYKAGVPIDKTTAGVFTVSTAIGSILPNIDTVDSKLGKVFHHISYAIQTKIGHRKLTHDVLIMVPLFVISIFVKNFVFFGIMLGIIEHLLLDGITKEGVCFNYFYYRKGFAMGLDRLGLGYIHFLPEILTFKNGSWRERILTVFLDAVNILIILMNEQLIFK